MSTHATFSRALGGAVAGVLAGLAMNQVHAVWSALERPRERKPSSGGDEPATVRAAESLVGWIEDPKRRARAGSLAHHAMAATTGAIYALAASALPRVQLGRGLGYGAAVWLIADELMVPALGLASWRAPLRTHARALVAHLVYGAALDSGLRVAGRLRA